MSGFFEKAKSSFTGATIAARGTGGGERGSEVSWEPVAPGGASFRTHAPFEPSPNILCFGPSVTTRAIALGLIALGLVACLAFPLSFAMNVGDTLPGVAVLGGLFGGLIGLAFIGVGLVFRFVIAKPRTFDRRLRLYVLGGEKDLERGQSLEGLMAIQILGEAITNKDAAYVSHELNLVFKDGRRLNVLDHADVASLGKDAQRLGRFLGVPVWDRKM